MEPLIDTYGRAHRYLRVAVTERCNLRCVYCMPPQGIPLKARKDLLNYEEIARLARIFATMGVNKVRLTGGEPLVRSEVEQLIARLAALEGIETIAMTTNGVLLAERAEALRRAGLTKLNISLDTLRPERFAGLALRDGHARVLAGIERALEVGFAPLKINVVVMRNVNEDELLDFVAWACDRPINVRFIEYMPFRGNGWHEAALAPYREMKAAIETRYRLRPLEGAPSDVAKDFALEGHRGTVSFVTSMTDDFCGGCDRIRLTADGHIKPCLFHASETNLRDAMRSGANDACLEGMIRAAVARKPSGHAPARELRSAQQRAMIAIGG